MMRPAWTWSGFSTNRPRAGLPHQAGRSEETVAELPLLGISSIGNLLCAIKFAKYYELTNRDIVLTVWTDSMDLYQSRLKEMEARRGLIRNSRRSGITIAISWESRRPTCGS